MRIKSVILFTLIGMGVFCSWKTGTEEAIEKARWLIGTWENKTQRGSIYETWTRVSDNELSGKSYRLQQKDTLVFETVKIIQEAQGLFYVPTVKGQNNDLPVRFALKSISDSILIFENAGHDFPQIISYRRVSADSLVAEISGSKNRQRRKQQFPMKRIK